MLKRRLIAASLVCLLLFSLANFSKPPSPKALPQTFAGRLLSFFYLPIQRVADATGRFFMGNWKGYVYLVGVKRENERLKEELAQKTLLVQSLKESVVVARGMQALEQKMEEMSYEGVSGRIMSYDPYNASQTLWISVGELNGIKIDQPVITLEGLVGRIIRVLPHTSQVMLLVDPHFTVDAINEETRARALVVGSGSRASLKRYPILSHLEFLKLGDEIKAGQLFITSGLNGIYPPGIPVGNVISIEKGKEDDDSNPIILPSVDFSKLEQVMVLTSVALSPPTTEVSKK